MGCNNLEKSATPYVVQQSSQLSTVEKRTKGAAGKTQTTAQLIILKSVLELFLELSANFMTPKCSEGNN